MITGPKNVLLIVIMYPYIIFNDFYSFRSTLDIAIAWAGLPSEVSITHNRESGYETWTIVSLPLAAPSICSRYLLNISGKCGLLKPNS